MGDEMLAYVRKAREAYDACDVKTEAVKARFLEDVINGAIAAAKKQPKQEMVVPKATKRLIKLSKESEDNRHQPSPILRKDIYPPVGIKCGLWPWLKGEADVIEKKSPRKDVAYQIKDEFYNEMKKYVCPIVEKY